MTAAERDGTDGPGHTGTRDTVGGPDGTAGRDGATGRDGSAGREAVVEAVLAAARVLVGVSAQSVAELADTVTLPQLRILVMVASRSPSSLRDVADELAVHPSNATRAVERLVTAGLLRRRDDPADRRNLLLELSPRGQELVAGIMEHRRTAVDAIVDRMPAAHRDDLRTGAAAFADAGDPIPRSAVWSLGWPT